MMTKKTVFNIIKQYVDVFAIGEIDVKWHYYKHKCLAWVDGENQTLHLYQKNIRHLSFKQTESLILHEILHIIQMKTQTYLDNLKLQYVSEYKNYFDKHNLPFFAEYEADAFAAFFTGYVTTKKCNLSKRKLYNIFSIKTKKYLDQHEKSRTFVELLTK